MQGLGLLGKAQLLDTLVMEDGDIMGDSNVSGTYPGIIIIKNQSPVGTPDNTPTATEQN